MSKTSKTMKVLAIILSTLMIVLTLNVGAVTSYANEPTDNIQIADSANVNIIDGDGNTIAKREAQEITESTTQPTTEEQTEIETVKIDKKIANLTLDISEGSITFRQDGANLQYKQGDSAWTTYTELVTITGTTTTNPVVVESGKHNITLNNAHINIYEDGGTVEYEPSAFDIQGTSSVTLTLAPDSTNTMESGYSSAGLQVQTIDGKTASVEIKGSGKLEVSAFLAGAGIGGAEYGTAGRITISETAQVTAIGSTLGAGIGGGSFGSGGIITIKDKATVIAKGYDSAAGIGGGYSGSGGIITISDRAIVTAIGGNETNEDNTYPSAIGYGGYDKNSDTPAGAVLKIGAETTVTAVPQGNGVAIDVQVPITAPEGENLANILQLNYETKVDAGTNTTLYSVASKNFTYTSNNVPYKSIAFAGVDSGAEYSVYTTVGEDTTKIWQEGKKGSSTEYTTVFVEGEEDKYTEYNSIKATEIQIQIDPTEKILYGSIKFRTDSTNGTQYSIQYSLQSSDWITYRGEFTINGEANKETQNTITVESGTHNITLNNVNINMSQYGLTAFYINGTSSVILTLAEGSINTLKSGAYRAGLQVQTIGSDMASVEIKGSGTLKATGGENSAGIGGGAYGYGGTITITDTANVTATGSEGGAGIGGGAAGEGGTITISSNATVTATGGSYAAGIGGGANSTIRCTVTISDTATVIAVSDGTKTAIYGTIKAPIVTGQKQANILQLNYQEQVAANTETAIFDSTSKVASFAPNVAYRSIAFGGLETNINYSVATKNIIQQGKNDASLTNEFIISSQLTTYTNVQATEEKLNLVTYVNKDGDVLAEEYVVTGETAPRPILPQLRAEEYVQDFEDSALENITKDTTLVYKKMPKIVEVTASLEYVDKLDITVDNAQIDTEVVYGKIVKATYTGEGSVIGWKINGHVVSVTNSKVYAFYVVETSIIEPILEGTAIEEIDINVGTPSYSTETNNTTKAYYPIVAVGYKDATEVKYGVIRSTVESDLTEENIRQYLADETKQTNSNIVREYTETGVMNGDGRYNYVAVMPTDTDKTLYVKAWIEVDGVLYVSEFPTQNP